MTENNQQKEEGDIDKILKESKDMDINFEKIINEGEQQNKNDGFEILKKEKDDSSQILPEVDVRVVSPEIIEILDKDIFKKYREGNNLRKIKVNTEENFLENQTLINMADLLGIKKITFKEINSNTFNSLLSRKSYMVKKSNKIKEDKINKKEKDDKGETENEINDETYLEEIVFDNCQMDIDYSKFFPLVKKFTLKNCKVPYNISGDFNFNFLTNLSLENIGLIDENCQSLFLDFIIDEGTVCLYLLIKKYDSSYDIIPRVTINNVVINRSIQDEIDAITSGNILYNVRYSPTDGLQYYNGSSWQAING